MDCRNIKCKIEEAYLCITRSICDQHRAICIMEVLEQTGGSLSLKASRLSGPFWLVSIALCRQSSWWNGAERSKRWLVDSPRKPMTHCLRRFYPWIPGRKDMMHWSWPDHSGQIRQLSNRKVGWMPGSTFFGSGKRAKERKTMKNESFSTLRIFKSIAEPATLCWIKYAENVVHRNGWTPQTHTWLQSITSEPVIHLSGSDTP